ncbi:hypothetical protein N836_32805 [Leptolyngbya sp. Heron Island J]|nr:hypothetical protein N836_32805 [Leptolyngbya sp. Heron Island J]
MDGFNTSSALFQEPKFYEPGFMKPGLIPLMISGTGSMDILTQ